MYVCDKERLKNKIETFSKFGATEGGGITRFSLSKEAKQAREEFISRMKSIGGKISFDDMGNIYARFEGSEDLDPIYTGSHADSVRNGGNYDGILGVMTAMEVAETIVKEKIAHKHPLVVMIWTNEEGSLYPPAIMSSGVIFGQLDHEAMLNSTSVEGKTFGQALEESGYKGSFNNRIDPKKSRALVELHIEQGPVLEAEKKDIGVVQGVLGMVNYRIETFGQADHAGTTPMKYRKDALLAASSALQYLHKELDKLDKDLVYTNGEISCHPCVHTVIPDYVSFSIEARHKNPEVIKQVVDIIKNMPTEMDKCKVTSKFGWSRVTVEFDEKLIGYVQESVNELGYPNLAMYSGAGHDAQYAAMKMPTTMIFVPSKDGHSHCEPEFTPLDQCWKGANVLLNTILKIDNE